MSALYACRSTRSERVILTIWIVSSLADMGVAHLDATKHGLVRLWNAIYSTCNFSVCHGLNRRGKVMGTARPARGSGLGLAASHCQILFHAVKSEARCPF
jgi:hypothetical protein